MPHQVRFAAQLLGASIMAARQAWCEQNPDPGNRNAADVRTRPYTREKTATNVIDAAASGASDGLKLALIIAAMLLAFIALIAALANYMLGLVGRIGELQWLPHLRVRLSH
jgi:CNT family concentrative nucleoside transporter